MIPAPGAAPARALRYVMTCRDVLRTLIFERFRPLTEAEHRALKGLAKAAGGPWEEDWREQVLWLEAMQQGEGEGRMRHGLPSRASPPALRPCADACAAPRPAGREP